MGTRFQPDWVKDQTLPPNWSLEYRPEAPGNKKWELMRGEGHYRMFQFHEDAILEARKQELADIESGAIAAPKQDLPRLCYGAQTATHEPDCDGPEVQRVRVFNHPDATAPFVTDWCVECRAEARRQGATIEEVVGLNARLRSLNVRGTRLYEVLIYDGEEPLAYAGGATFTPEKAKEEALAVYKRRIVGAEVELRNVQKRIDDMKAIINSIKELPDA